MSDRYNIRQHPGILKNRFTILPVIIFSACFTPIKQDDTVKEIQFEKIIYRSGRCNGTCPKIDMVIEKDGEIWTQREFYISKVEVDISKSGKFEGVLTEKELKELKVLLKESSYSNINMPDINVVDLSMLTLIIYDGKKRNWFKFVNPPKEIKALVSFLNQLATEKKLEKTEKQRQLEE